MTAPSFSYDYQLFNQTINLPDVIINITFYDHEMCGPLMMIIKFNDKCLRLDTPVSGNERMLNFKLAKYLFELSMTVDNSLSLLQRLACFQCMCYQNLSPLILEIDKDATYETNVWKCIDALEIDGEFKYLNEILPLMYKDQVFHDNRHKDEDEDENEENDEEDFLNSLEPCVKDDFITYTELWEYINICSN
jgi:hypothetical protein